MDILETKKVKTRKSHRCWGCENKFSQGTEMSYVKSVDCGDINTVYWCQPCNDFANLIPWWEGEDGYQPGDILELKEEYPEEWTKTHPLEELLKDPCFYDPVRKKPVFENDVHAKAEWIVGYNGNWRLCAKCAALPEFKRFRIRTKI